MEPKELADIYDDLLSRIDGLEDRVADLEVVRAPTEAKSEDPDVATLRQRMIHFFEEARFRL